MADSSRWWAWQHPTIVATLLFFLKVVCTTSKAAPFLSLWNWNRKKSDPHLFWILMDLIKLESAITLEKTIKNWQKLSLPKKSGFLQMFLKKYLSEFFGFCQDLKLVFMRFHELIPSKSYHHSKNKNWRKKKSTKSLQEINDTRIHTEHPSILIGS